MSRCSKSEKTSPYYGVSYHRATGRWRVHVGREYVGLFVDEVAAAHAFNERAVVVYGPEHPRLNFRQPPTPDDGARAIELPGGKWTFVDAGDFEWLNHWHWSVTGTREAHGGYVQRLDEERRSVLMHKLIFGPGESFVDHVDRDKLNNRRSNLRAATRQQNGANRSKSAGCSSQYKGVSLNSRRDRWNAEIRVNGIARRLGSFPLDREQDAARAYDAAAIEAWGEFAAVNLPQECCAG